MRKWNCGFFVLDFYGFCRRKIKCKRRKSLQSVLKLWISGHGEGGIKAQESVSSFSAWVLSKPDHDNLELSMIAFGLWSLGFVFVLHFESCWCMYISHSHKIKLYISWRPGLDLHLIKMDCNPGRAMLASPTEKQEIWKSGSCPYEISHVLIISRLGNRRSLQIG